MCTSPRHPRAIPPAVCGPCSPRARGQSSRTELHTLDAKCVVESSFRDRCVSGTGDGSFGGNGNATHLPRGDYFLADFSLWHFLFYGNLPPRKGAGPRSISGLAEPGPSALGHCCPQAASPDRFHCHLPGDFSRPDLHRAVTWARWGLLSGVKWLLGAVEVRFLELRSPAPACVRGPGYLLSFRKSYECWERKGGTSESSWHWPHSVSFEVEGALPLISLEAKRGRCRALPSSWRREKRGWASLSCSELCALIWGAAW